MLPEVIMPLVSAVAMALILTLPPAEPSPFTAARLRLAVVKVELA